MKSRHQPPADSLPMTSKTDMIHHNCHTSILSHWQHRLPSNVNIHVNLKLDSGVSSNNFHQHKSLNRLIYLYRQMRNNNSTDELNSISQSLSNRSVHALRNHTRTQRSLSHENNLNGEKRANMYGNEDQNYFKNRQEDIDEEKQSLDGEYYIPLEAKFRMRTNNRLYEDDTNHINRFHDEQEHNSDKRFMQNDEKLITADRLSNGEYLNLNNDNYRSYIKNNYNRKRYQDKDFNNYMLDNKQRDLNERKYLENDYLDRQEQPDNEE